MLDRQELGRTIALPGFPAYLRSAVAIWRAQDSVDPALSSSLRDLGRFASGVWSLYLDATPGGITLIRLGVLLGEAGISGPGRARSILIFLRFIGFIESTENVGDKRAKRYRVTDRMMAAFHERYRRELDAGSSLDPVVAAGHEALDRPEFFRALVAAMGELSLAALQTYAPRDASLDVISHQYAGMTVVGELIGSCDAPGGPFPPVGPTSISMAGIAKACGISRTQVRRILKAGANEGSFELSGEGEVNLTPLLAEHVELLVAGTFMMFRWCCEQALAKAGSVGVPTPQDAAAASPAPPAS